MVTFVVKYPRQKLEVSCNFRKGFLHSLEIRMRVDIQRYTDIGVPHEILQTFHINTALLHIRTEGVAQNMGRYPGKGISIDSVDLFLNTSHIVLQKLYLSENEVAESSKYRVTWKLSEATGIRRFTVKEAA